jgi:hypothetical protein
MTRPALFWSFRSESRPRGEDRGRLGLNQAPTTSRRLKTATPDAAAATPIPTITIEGPRSIESPGTNARWWNGEMSRSHPGAFTVAPTNSIRNATATEPKAMPADSRGMSP